MNLKQQITCMTRSLTNLYSIYLGHHQAVDVNQAYKCITPKRTKFEVGYPSRTFVQFVHKFTSGKSVDLLLNSDGFQLNKTRSRLSRFEISWILVRLCLSGSDHHLSPSENSVEGVGDRRRETQLVWSTIHTTYLVCGAFCACTSNDRLVANLPSVAVLFHAGKCFQLSLATASLPEPNPRVNLGKLKAIKIIRLERQLLKLKLTNSIHFLLNPD